jgi:iron complex outermembrane receptor protein
MQVASALWCAWPAFGQQTQPAVPAVNTTVDVIGDATPVSAVESSRTVVVFDAQEHPLAAQDVEDYLRMDASVDIQQRAPAGVMADISIRGATFEQTLVLLHGLRINDVETSHFNLDLPVPLATVGGMDVLHGAGSTVYGSDAIGGVLDVETWKPEADTLRLRAGAGSFGENEVGALGSLVKGSWSEVVAGDHFLSTGFMPDRDYRTESLSSKTRGRTAAGDSDVLLAADDRSFGANQFYGDYDSWERTKGWFVGATQQFDPHTQADFGFRRHTDIFVLLRDAPSVYKNQHVDDGFEGDVRYAREILPHTTLLTGLEETTDQIASTNLGDHGRNRGAGYSELQWRIPGHASLAAGLREEVYSGGRVVSSPTSAATLWLPHQVKLRASMSYGFRIPTYLDLYYSDPATLGNANLKPESAWSYDAGLDWYPTPRLDARLTGFYSDQKNTIDYTRTTNAQPWMATNLPGLDFKGIEAAVDWNASRTQQIRLNWTFLTGAQKALGGLQSEYVGNYATNDARATWTWTPRRQVVVQTRIGVLQRYQQTAYAAWDTSVTRELGRVRPYLQMKNLANTGYQEIAGVRMPGRSLIGGVELVLSRGH